MSRAVFIGGFGNGRRGAEGVSEALRTYFAFEDVDGFTFSDANKSPGVILKAVKGVEVFTQSAGMMALRGTAPEAIHAFSAPLPTGRARLLGRTIVKTVRMNTPGLGIRSMADSRAAMAYGASSGAELSVHPSANLRPFLTGEISRLDSLQEGIQAKKSGIFTTLICMDNDAFFTLTEEGQQRAEQAGVEVIRMPGVHDELVLRPDATVRNYLFAF